MVGQSNTSSNYMVNTVETDTLDSAINISNAYMNKNINLSHCKILVVSEEVAKKGIEDLVNSLINKVEIRPDCNIVVSKIPKGEFTDSDETQLEKVLYKYYDIVSNIDSGYGYSEAIKLSDFYLDLNDSFRQPFATLGITSNNSKTNLDNVNKDEKSNLDVQSRTLTSTPDEVAVETMGLAVFNNDTLVGTLSANQTMCHQLIIDTFNHCTLNIPSPFHANETLDIYFSQLKSPKIKVNITNGSPFVEINLYLTSRILSFNSKETNTLTEEKLNIIKSTIIQHMEKQMYDYLDKTSKELNSDIGGIGRYAAQNFKTSKEWENYNWLENYKNCTFKVNISTTVKAGQLLTEE